MFVRDITRLFASLIHGRVRGMFRKPSYYLVTCLVWLMCSGLLIAAMPGNPQSLPEADEIAQQVYTSAHGGLLRNAISRRKGRDVAVVVNRAPLEMRTQGRRPGVQTFETYVNNSPADSAIKSQQMAILTSGKTKGTGVLLTRYTDSERGSTISMWLPALRKIRRINEPSHEDVWFGTNLTYGELVLRTPEDEEHELLGVGKIEACLEVMRLERSEKSRHTLSLPGPQCAHIGKAVYRLKSTTKFKNWWYDYHVTEIDQRTYAPYRTVYYKNGEKIKTVSVDWQSLDQPDPRITYPRYIYAISHGDGKDSMVFVPRTTISLNVELDDSYWSEETLRNYGK
ncbi:MAG: outer membrane lipoprotein-sorting protein [Candidatus Thiodiazotropha sp. LLP2]